MKLALVISFFTLVLLNESYGLDNLVIGMYGSDSCKENPQAFSIFDLDQVYMRDFVEDPEQARKASSHSCSQYLLENRKAKSNVCLRPDLFKGFVETHSIFFCSSGPFDPSSYFGDKPYFGLIGSEMEDCTDPLYSVYLLADGSCVAAFKDPSLASSSYKVTRENNTVIYSTFDSHDCTGPEQIHKIDLEIQGKCSKTKKTETFVKIIHRVEEKSFVQSFFPRIFTQFFLPTQA
jgi:hypothetical protein